MHQSSYSIMIGFKELVDKHFQDEKIAILDIKTYGMKDDYKNSFAEPEKYLYTGIDVNPEPNVDYTPADPYCWPELQDESFDVIISGQTFEHIEYPWLIIEEMNRVLKKNGLICIVAPSRGPEHKYPVDCWRYYPDGFRALAKWVNLQVLESKATWGKSGFTDGSDQWGDAFCILFKPENQEIIIRLVHLGLNGHDQRFGLGGNVRRVVARDGEDRPVAIGPLGAVAIGPHGPGAHAPSRHARREDAPCGDSLPI